MSRDVASINKDGFLVIRSSTDPVTGEPRKVAFGAWMMSAFRGLARLRRLRGTAFDLFGYQAERRRERALIADYEATIAAILPKLGRVNYETAVRLAALPEQIRGFGHVKEKAMNEAEAKRTRLLAEFGAAKDLAHSAA